MSSNLTEFARGQRCTFRIPDVCTDDPETVVACHISIDGLAGMGQKVPDLLVAHGCHACHDVIDGRAPWPASWDEADRHYFKLRALARTLVRVSRSFTVRRK